MKTNSRAREVSLALFYLGLGLASGFLWQRLANLAELPKWHWDMISGKAPAPNQYRPLTPWLAEGLSNLLPSGDLILAYILLRGVVTGLALWLFDRYLRTWFQPVAAAAGALALAAIIPFTYFPVVQESDPLNLVAIISAFWVIAAGKDLWLFPIIFVGTLNRETTALIPALYLLARWGERPLRQLLPRTLVLGVLWAAVFMGLRLLYGSRSYYCDVIMWNANIQTLMPTLHLILMYGALWGIAVLGAKSAPMLLRRGIWLIPPYLVLHYIVAIILEVRLFLPLAPLVIPLSWWYLFPEARLSQEPNKRRK